MSHFYKPRSQPLPTFEKNCKRMQDLKIPAGYQAVMPYLILPDAAAFMDWAIAVLGATEKMRSYSPDGTTLAHSEILLGESTIMIGESSTDWPANTAGLFVYVADVDACYASALASGATSLMPLTDRPYGRTCGVLDRWGNTWWPTQSL
jgi:PhnB protein